MGYGRIDGVALVTGASSGIGAAIARGIAAHGGRVVLAARRIATLEGLAAEIGPSACAIALDVTDAAAVAALPGSLPEGFGAVSILVNNAAHDIGGRARFDEPTADEMASVIETGLTGALRVTRALVGGMVARKQGDIVNIGSVNTLRTSPTLAAYTAAKMGLHGLTEVLRADFAGQGIRVMEVVPGLTRTEFAEKRFRGDAEKTEAHFRKAGMPLDAEDVADAVLYALTRPRRVNISQIVVAPANHW